MNDSRRATVCAQLPKVHIRIVPNIDNPSRSLIFDIVDRELEHGTKLFIGRYSERHMNSDCLSFKSKVVSRCHCEIWVEQDGKLYIRDTKSSSGTFLNHVRLSPAGQESRSVEIHDGDLLQLGVDFQGGREEVYRSVKMKFELNRRHTRPLSFSLTAFQNLRSLTTQVDAVHDDTKTTDECCICLYALAPFQALFVAPCSHSFHFKCIRPLFQSYPGFQCPLCRTYSDLEANVAIEQEEMGHDAVESNLQSSPLSSSPSFHDVHHIEQEEDTNINRYTTAVAIEMESVEDINENPNTNNSHQIIEGSSLIENANHVSAAPRERKTSYILDKLKTVFFEKRKSNVISTISIKRRNKASRRERPISFPNFGMAGEPSMICRQPTT
ncbi:hypothetical protein G6F46_003020 [Rhizopus delemar]|uniref:SMAD/FHA domain-containing protein n=2 Tax=Rhizopus TaxID=4842 RepID=A0A9P6Z564_9FUNG|nr:hypothetical protein G6F55_002291 [Rhizopus delemar]KAG1550215.1 hypothetical protein G6F51_002579 [Rhizopus arrhizus]KAG1498924.1 hypothetical protein G6F54_004746 [Rhizopus delemar]KAG1515889.1 hypothetical protein G6F53_002576 [Rhizopus delemar]KAG1527355.1 hypothetical protein G6F52_001612 [Rhizopus delemar]